MGISPQRKTKRRAVILLSGGLDSATAAAIAKRQGFALYALSFDYGQRHRRELLAARRLAKQLAVKEHRILRVDLRAIGGSALTSGAAVPKNRSAAKIGQGIPATYVPARNTVFLAIALGYAETLGAFDIFLGANAIDYSGYPDCREEYLRSFERMANLATKAGVERAGRFRIHAPLLRMSKAQIVRRARALGLDLAMTWSCYDPTRRGEPCGRCDSCLLRKKGFEEASLPSRVK